MKKYKVLFADLDGTLIRTQSGETFPKGIWDMELRLEVFHAIKILNPIQIFIVSNQGGIEKGFINKENFEAKLEYVARSLSEYCGCEVRAGYCDSNDKEYPFRKPNTMMLENFINQYSLIKKGAKEYSLMIGDASGKEGQWSDTDKKTAENFGCDYMDVDDFARELIA